MQTEELTKEETEDVLLRSLYGGVSWGLHERKVQELIDAETAAINELTLRPITQENVSKLNFHIAKREGLQVTLYLKDDVALDSDQEESV